MLPIAEICDRLLVRRQFISDVQAKVDVLKRNGNGEVLFSGSTCLIALLTANEVLTLCINEEDNEELEEKLLKHQILHLLEPDHFPDFICILPQDATNLPRRCLVRERIFDIRPISDSTQRQELMIPIGNKLDACGIPPYFDIFIEDNLVYGSRIGPDGKKTIPDFFYLDTIEFVEPWKLNFMQIERLYPNADIARIKEIWEGVQPIQTNYYQ